MSSVTRGLDRTKQQKQYSEGRICKHKGCKTRLSIYNPNETCAIHTTAPGGRPK
jgi:hypothetical protein